jgi:hypothetical protein
MVLCDKIMLPIYHAKRTKQATKYHAKRTDYRCKCHTYPGSKRPKVIIQCRTDTGSLREARLQIAVTLCCLTYFTTCESLAVLPQKHQIQPKGSSNLCAFSLVDSQAKRTRNLSLFQQLCRIDRPFSAKVSAEGGCNRLISGKSMDLLAVFNRLETSQTSQVS